MLSVDEFAAFVKPWASEHEVCDGELASFCAQLAEQIWDTSRGSPVPEKPSRGLSLSARHGAETRLQMIWRGVLLETGEEVFAGTSAYGSYWAAELCAIVEAFNWADDYEYKGTIYSRCEPAIVWWRTKDFVWGWSVPEGVSQRIKTALSVRWPDRLRMWDEGSWGTMPSDLQGMMPSTVPTQDLRRRKRRRR